MKHRSSRIGLMIGATALLMLTDERARSQVSPATTAPSAAGETGEAPNPARMIEDALEKIWQADYKSAAELADKAAQLAPRMDKLKLVRGLIYAQAPNKGPEAVRDLTEYCRTRDGRQDHRGFSALGDIYFKSRNYRQSKESFEQAWKYAPPDDRGRPVRAEIGLQIAYIDIVLGHAKDGMERATAARDLASRNTTILERFGQIAYMAGPQYHNEALVALQQCIALLERVELPADPFDKDKLKRLRSCYVAVATIYDARRKENSSNSGPYYAVARATYELTRVDRQIALQTARDWAIKAVDLDPNNNEYILFLVELEMDMGALREARERIDALLAREPTNEKAGNMRKALEEFEAVRSSR